MENWMGIGSGGLSPADEDLLDDLLSELPSDPVTYEEFKASRRVSNSEHRLEDVMVWARKYRDVQE
jgi:hypothetical protein